MKKSFFLTASVIVFSFVVNAQNEDLSLKQDVNSKDKEKTELKKEVRTEKKELRKLEGKEVNSRSKEQFSIDFGTIADVKWVRTTNFDEATFTKEGKKLTAYYDIDFNLVGTIQDKSFTDLPIKAQNEIDKKYKEHSKSVVFFDDNEANETDFMLWNKQFDDQDNYFIEVKKDNKNIVLRVNPEGVVFYFTSLKS